MLSAEQYPFLDAGAALVGMQHPPGIWDHRLRPTTVQIPLALILVLTNTALGSYKYGQEWTQLW
jgi:hypothetical protein